MKKWNMKLIGPMCLVLSAMATSGCIPSHDVSQDDINDWWTLTPAEQQVILPSKTATPEKRELGMPRHWTIRQSDSVIGATVSLVRAMDAIDAGADRVEFSLADDHIQPVLDMLADVRSTMGELNAMLGGSGEVNRQAWASTLAEALVTVELVARRTAGQADASQTDAAMAAKPVLDLMTSMMESQSGQRLLAELDVKDIGRLRQSLVQVILRMGFDIAGRQTTPQLTTQTARKLRNAEDLTKIQGDLALWLAEQLEEASPSATGNREVVKDVLAYGPKGILMFERFFSQWGKMESMTVDFAKTTDDSQALVATVRVKDGQEIRIDDIMTGVPVIVIRGESRISVLPGGGPAESFAVTFNPVDEGAIELRFEGLLYGLVRLFAFPLDDGPLREIRVATASRSRGEQLLNVAVLMESSRDVDDPRRMLSVQDVRRKRVVRDVLETRTVTEHSETLVHYITPQKRYTYQRIKNVPEK
jgi:hypothetical protein